MYLKRLEIFGFKSFADKTELDFGPGITAVVGPNGSGKSNVSDAIRWVLGEQSAKALRGGSMADVIFAGSDGKKAMGFAQVSLVLDNTDGRLGVGFTEVMVTRRVDRSGEGEYFINQVPCRLKDVQDLFLDTGVGKDNYSIIGQGKIDEILSSKPEDRRALCEEAAGISRYKARKKEAQRRLEETEQNLLRITDIIGELANQMDSLADQAKRAEAFSELNAELTRLDVGLLAYSLKGVADRLEKQLGENQRLKEKLTDLEEKLTAGDQAAEVARNLAESLDQELAVVSSQLAEATGRVERAEGRMALAAQEQKGAQAEQLRLEGELGLLETKLQAVIAEAGALEEQVLRLQGDLQATIAEQTGKEQALQGAQAEVAAASRAVEAKKGDIVAILQQEAEKRNAVLAAEQAGEEAARRMARLQGERERAEQEAESARLAAAAVAEQQVSLSGLKDRATVELNSLRQQRQEADRKLQELQQKGGAIREQIQGSSSRLGAIEEMMNAFEGYQKGTRTVLMGREQGHPWATEVLGAVAEVIRTEPKYEKAIEIALGGNIQNIITATDTGAKAAIEHLKKSNGGRATFLPLGSIRANSFRPDEEREFKGAPGIIGVALELVRFEDRFRPAMASLLGRTLIASDIDAALAFGRKTGQRYRLVTLDGELLAAGGALTGGSTGGQGAGLLSRERERDELTAKIAQLREDLAATRKEYDELQARRGGWDKQVQHAEIELRAVETKITQAEGEARRVAGEAKRWEETLAGFASEAALIQSDAAGKASSADGLRQELADLAARKAELEAEVARMHEDGQARLAALDEQSRELTGAQVRLAQLSQELKGLTGQRGRLEADAEGLKAETASKEAQKAAAGERLVQAALDMETARLQLEEATAERIRFEADRDRIHARKLEALEQVNNREREMRTFRRAQTDTQSRAQAGEVEEARLRMEQESLIQRLSENYGLTPIDVTGKELADAEVAFARERTHTLREEVRALGPVNLQAIDEYRTAQERFVFLGQQRDDLTEAKESLYRAVDELEKRIKTHFLESFGVIRKEFQRVYQELFEGGKADLHLVDENDLLETGIEIISQPPGKKPQTLSLLSGGERAMTASALLFALLRVKPTPFVVLDEVEAALDEANVERIGKYLRSYSQTGHVQFICITHQRGTMEVADALYGVTMEGTGVSKVVSVRLVDLEREREAV
ncbi:MAG TPA: chromosome segregation protein SMC [Symbiobacteriaceae bacterium]|nr:chromosome segregation protein SMC [Symbiobacteriaceae bacterium]